MHYYQFNIGDYAKSTKYLDPMEDLIYRRLIDVCYDTEKPLPESAEKVAKLIGLKNNLTETQAILDEYFKLTKNGYIQKRIQKELDKYKGKAQAARANGKLGGRPKKTQSVILANPEETQSKANQEPLTNNHKPITKVIDYSCFLNFSDDQISELKRIRKKNKGGSITQRVANALAKEFNQAELKGFSIDQSLTEWELRGWKSFKSEWMKGESNQARTFSKVTEQNIINTMGWSDE